MLFGNIRATVRIVTLFSLGLGTALAQESIDLDADAIEITQGIQDLNNTVRMVANRWTFVKLYGHIKSGPNSSLAGGTLTIIPEPGNGPSTALVALNGQQMLTKNTTIDRTKYFLFQVPTELLKPGKVEFRGRVTTTVAGQFDPDAVNNNLAHEMTFEKVPNPKVITYRMNASNPGCSVGYEPATDYAEKFRDYSYLVFPIEGISISDRGWKPGDEYNRDGSIQCGLIYGDTGSAFILRYAARLRAEDLAANTGTFDFDTRYFGFIQANPDYYRASASFPGTGSSGSAAAGSVGSLGNASGQFSTGSRGYDMAGWVGAHELGHSYGLHHALATPLAPAPTPTKVGTGACGEIGAVRFPNSLGYISNTTAGGDDDLWGFNVITRDDYPPTSFDFMSYCMGSPGQWISKESYHRLMDSLINNWKKFPTGDKGWPSNLTRTAEADGTPRLATGTAMLISGVLNLTNPAKSVLDPIHTSTAPIPDPVTGPYEIVFKAGNAELGRAVLEIVESEKGPPVSGTLPPDDAVTFTQWIPAIPGATRVDVQSPSGIVFASLLAGLAPPVVRITSPNGGETFPGTMVNVAWTASDADFDDRLTYNLALSGNGGLNWQTLIDRTSQTSATLPRDRFAACTQCLIRVTATDGIHSASDVSDAVFTLPNQPAVVEIVSPGPGSKTAPNYSTQLAARIFDADGSVEDSSVVWTSSISGALGAGRRLSVRLVGVGKHVITVTVPDGSGTKTASIDVNVVASSTELTQRDMTQLRASLSGLAFTSSSLQVVQQIGLSSSNANPLAVIAWTASSSQPWVLLGAASGTTAGTLAVSLGNTGALPIGVSAAVVTITAAGLPPIQIPVSFTRSAPASLLSIDPGGVVNSADYSNGAISGMITSVFGSGFATAVTQAQNVPLPRTLDGVSVEIIDGVKVTQAPLYFVSPGLINFQLPTVITSPTIKVRVKNAQGVSAEETVVIALNRPAVFTRAASGVGIAIAIRTNYTFVETSSPLRPGENAFIYMNALGPVSPVGTEGNYSGDNGVSGPVNLATDQISIKYAGRTVTPQYAGLAPGLVGVYQVNFQVPADIDDSTCSFRITANGVESRGEVVIPCRK